MMTGSCEVDTSYLLNQLANRWIKKTGASQSKIIKQSVKKQISFYVQQLAEQNGDYLYLKEDKDLVSLARSNLVRAPALERIFNNLINKGQKLSYSPISSDQDVLLPPSIGRIEGLFTEKGWTNIMARAGNDLSSTSQAEDCVLGGQANQISSNTPNSQQMTRHLYNLYIEQYAKEWKQFVHGVKVKDFRNLKEAAEALKILSKQDSPLTMFLQEVSQNSQLAMNSNFDGVAQKFLEKKFKAIHQLVVANDQETPISLYTKELAKVQSAIQDIADADVPGSKAKSYAENVLNNGSDELHNAWSTTDNLLLQLDPASSELVRELLRQPIRNAWSIVADEASGYLSKLWKAQVYEFYRKKLYGKYPFAVSKEDALISDVVNFFKPGDGILPGFFEQNLRSLITDGTWGTKRWIGKSISFSTNTLRRADTITRSMFPDGSAKPRVSFDLEPLLPRTQENYCMILSYYGTEFNACSGSFNNWALKWPNHDGVQQVIFVIYKKSGEAQPAKLICDGEWSLFRLLDYATSRTRQYNQIRISWTLQSQNVNAPVGFLLRPTSPSEIFKKDFFASFACPGNL